MRRKASLAVALPVLLTMLLGACSGGFRYADPTRAHRGPEGFRNLDQEVSPAVGAPWYEVMMRRWRGDFEPSAPPEGGYEAFAQRWRQPLRAEELDIAARAESPRLAWLSHAGVWLQVGGQRILIDPQLSDFAGPIRWLSSRRRVSPPIQAEDLPAVDVLLITHSHYDHLDLATVQAVLARNPKTRVLVPLGLRDWMLARGALEVEELDWWDARQLGPLQIRLLPAQHWSRRTLGDTNQTLWGGWEVVWTPQGAVTPWRFVHVGDTGFNESLYRQIGQRLAGPVDLLAVPIGAYEPRDFMKRQHANPDEAVRIAQLLQARQALGIHWGTFELTQEPFDQPPRDLAQALQQHGLPSDYVWLMRQGELRAMEKP